MTSYNVNAGIQRKRNPSPVGIKSKTIVHVIGATIAGGAEVFVARLAMALAAAGADVYLLALSSRSDVVGDHWREHLGASKIKLRIGPTVKVGLRTLRWYRAQLTEIAPLIVHLHTPNTELVHSLSAASSRRGQPILFRTLHNTVTHHGFLTRFAINRNRVRTTIACGTEVAALASKTQAKPVECIANGIDFSWPSQTRELQQEARLRLGINTRCIHFISIGRMSSETLSTLQKAQDVILHAWVKANFGDEPVHLHLLGDGNLRSSLELIAADDNTITFHGVRADVHDWLLAADFFVMPSRYEGLPIAGIEAVGTGLPCIFSNIAPLRELGSTETLWVPVDDIDALAESFVTASKHVSRPDRLDVDAFRERYGIAETSRRYLHAYQKSLADCFSAEEHE